MSATPEPDRPTLPAQNAGGKRTPAADARIIPPDPNVTLGLSGASRPADATAVPLPRQGDSEILDAMSRTWTRRLLALLAGIVAALLLVSIGGRVGLRRPQETEITNSIGMKLRLIPAGKFLMGSPGRFEGEGPQREVEISRPFYLGVYPVTQQEYRRVMGKNPSRFSAEGGDKENVAGMDTDRFPVESVSWYDAVAFCEKLSALAEEKKAGRVYRLPTEAEWEYACRAGTTTAFWWGDSASSLRANFDGRFPSGGAEKGPFLRRTCPVGSYKPNPWGLYDMGGNVPQWCSDWYDPDFYGRGINKDPNGPENPAVMGGGFGHRVCRGGYWCFEGGLCRAACRGNVPPATSEVSACGWRSPPRVAGPARWAARSRSPCWSGRSRTPTCRSSRR
jgi:formylglycine-generating enzyme required for sulfatase activity